MDSITDMYVYNNKRWMIKYTDKSIRIRRSTADKISLDKRKVKIQLAKKDSLEGLMLTLINIFYISNSLLTLISFGLFNDSKIYHYNKN